jgi:hypothetical protein
MLEPIDGLPDGVWGLRAVGEVSHADYQNVVIPHLERVKQEGRRVRLLFHFGQLFERFTPAGALSDARVGVSYMGSFERLAIVTDVDWVRSVSALFAELSPWPVKIYRNEDFDGAVRWLAEPATSTLHHTILSARRVLFIEPQRELRTEDFDALRKSIEDFTRSTNTELNGIVIHARERPHWANLASFLQHVRFVLNAQSKVRRVAIAANGNLVAIIPPIVDRLLHPEIRAFSFDEVDRAIDWASGERTTSSAGDAAAR